MGRYDASYGNLLLGDGKGRFKVISNENSGINIKGEVRSLRKIIVDGRAHYLGFRNNESIIAFSLKNSNVSN